MSITMVYATVSPFIFQNHFNVTPITYGWIVLITASGGVIGKVLSPILIRKYNSLNTLFVGVILLTFSGVLVFFINLCGYINIVTITICAFIAILSAPFILPFAASKALGLFNENRGSAGALYGCFQMFIAFLMSFTVSIMTYNSIFIIGGCYLILGVIGVLIIFYIKKYS